MSVQPNTNGYLVRSASLPANATGWAVCFWFRRTGAVGAGLIETLFEIIDNGDTDSIKIYVTETGDVHYQSVNDFEDVTLFNAALNTWYFIALKTFNATTGDVFWRADTDSSLSSSTGRKFQTDNGWDAIYLLNNAGLLETAQHFQMSAYKEYATGAGITSAQLLTDSRWRSPQMPFAAFCYLPFTSASGTDQSGAGHNFTITGTLAASTSEPASMDVLQIRPRSVRGDLAHESPLQRRLLPLAAFGVVVPPASIPGPRVRAARDDLILSDLQRRRALPFAALDVPAGGGGTGARSRLRDRQRGRDRWRGH